MLQKLLDLVKNFYNTKKAKLKLGLKSEKTEEYQHRKKEG